MKLFIDFSNQEDVSNIIKRASQNSNVQGVVIEVDRLAIRILRLVDIGVSQLELRRYFQEYIWSNTSELNEPPWIPRRPITKIDLDTISEFWSELRWMYGPDPVKYESPFIIKICLYPPQPGEVIDIEKFDSQYRIIYETRPRASLISMKSPHRPLSGGISIGVNNTDYGTLGGILKDGSGDAYGVTCAHVALSLGNDADQPAFCDSSARNLIGKVEAISDLKICDCNSPCNKDSPFINETDVALIKLDKTVTSKHEVLSIGPVVDVTPLANLSQGQSVEMTGRTSGNTSLELGGMGMFYRLDDGKGNCYCFKNVIVLNKPSYWRTVASPPVSSGDSGAWVCAPIRSGHSWSGVAIGGDRWSGYMISSEVSLDFLQTKKAGLVVS